MMDDITIFEKRKKDMMELWKDTFHDSDRYISLVFDTYYSIENSFVRYHENRLIAALLCVDYEFQILTKDGDRRCIRGMYLCGLATRPEWRRKGIMSQLMEEADDAGRKRGYDMTFLIPADDHLRHYYSLKGYRTASWRKLQKVVRYSKNLTDGHLQDSHIYSIKKLFETGKTKFLCQLAEWCRDIEASRHTDTIVHSREDFMTIMAENENSIFLTYSSFDPEFPILAKVRGVVFPEVSDASEEPLRVVGLYVRGVLPEEASVSRGEVMRLRKTINEKFVLEIRDIILRWFDRTNLELLLPYSEGSCHEKGVLPYAMIKPLTGNVGILSENENSMVEISLMLD